MLFNKFTVPLAMLLATAAARPYTPEEADQLRARLAEADRRAAAENTPNPLYPRATAAPKVDSFPPWYDPYNPPSASPEEDSDSPSDSPLPPTPLNTTHHPSPVQFNPYLLAARNANPNPVPNPEAFRYGGTPNPDGIKYNGPYTYASHVCGGNFGWASNMALKDGIEYLAGVKGVPANGPMSCGRVSCSWGAGIFWCNDSNHPISLKSYDDIGEAALFLTGACTKYKGDQQRTAGQIFFKERFSVYISEVGDIRNC